jgi:hypothetical protein
MQPIIIPRQAKHLPQRATAEGKMKENFKNKEIFLKNGDSEIGMESELHGGK